MRSPTSSPAGHSALERYAAERVVHRSRRALAAALFAAALLVAVFAAWSVGGSRHAAVAAAAAGAVLFAAGLVARPPRDPQRWLRGAHGEIATAELLRGLSARRWKVLHDRRVPGSRANIDHVVIGPTGVWVLDTKAYRAPLRIGWRSVWVAGRRLDTAPVVWEASVVADRLGCPVRPLVVVHGHGLPRRGRRCGGVRVVPADATLRRLRKGRRRLGRAEVVDLAGRSADALPPASSARAAGQR